MIGLDTNVVVRYITHDDPAQTAAAVRMIDSCAPDHPGFLSLIAMVELVWVLESCYHFTKNDIVTVLESLLRSKELVIEQAETVSSAFRLFRLGRAEFADCLIERCGHAAECQYTATFDQKAATVPGMRLIK